MRHLSMPHQAHAAAVACCLTVMVSKMRMSMFMMGILNQV